jgi:predicted DNA-binding protein
MGRPKIKDKKETLSVKLPPELKAWLAAHCQESAQSAGEIIKELLEFYRGLK